MPLIEMASAPAFAVGHTAQVPVLMDQQDFPTAFIAARAVKGKPQPTPNSTASWRRSGKVTESELRSAIDAWQLASRTYKAAAAVRATAVVSINETFTAAVRRAKTEFEAVRAQVNTPAAKSAAAARFADAVSAAAAMRQAALDSLPPLPPSPGSKPTLKSLATLRRQAAATPSPFAG